MGMGGEVPTIVLMKSTAVNCALGIAGTGFAVRSLTSDMKSSLSYCHYQMHWANVAPTSTPSPAIPTPYAKIKRNVFSIVCSQWWGDAQPKHTYPRWLVVLCGQVAKVSPVSFEQFTYTPGSMLILHPRWLGRILRWVLHLRSSFKRMCACVLKRWIWFVSRGSVCFQLIFSALAFEMKGVRRKKNRGMNFLWGAIVSERWSFNRRWKKAVDSSR